jgi:hypothetical protein
MQFLDLNAVQSRVVDPRAAWNVAPGRSGGVKRDSYSLKSPPIAFST